MMFANWEIWAHTCIPLVVPTMKSTFIWDMTTKCNRQVQNFQIQIKHNLGAWQRLLLEGTCCGWKSAQHYTSLIWPCWFNQPYQLASHYWRQWGHCWSRGGPRLSAPLLTSQHNELCVGSQSAKHNQGQFPPIKLGQVIITNMDKLAACMNRPPIDHGEPSQRFVNKKTIIEPPQRQKDNASVLIRWSPQL